MLILVPVLLISNFLYGQKLGPDEVLGNLDNNTEYYWAIAKQIHPWIIENNAG
jgi:hypothetical protein